MKNFTKILIAALFLISIAIVGCKKNTDNNPGGDNPSGGIGGPLCFTAEESNSEVKIMRWGIHFGSPNLEYSFDKTNWHKFSLDTTIILNRAGDKVYFRGDNPNGLPVYRDESVAAPEKYHSMRFRISKPMAVSGNIMSLIDPTCESKTIPNAGCFYKLFEGINNVSINGINNVSITSAPELPATTLTKDCYYGMFMECRLLEKAPQLPATSLYPDCYNYMFVGCSGLTQAPALPATSLAEGCYRSMFADCTGLTQAPALPATSLYPDCYNYMFVGCTGLTQAPALPATSLAEGCYSAMFVGCTGLTQAPALPATSLAKACYWAMFSNCSNIIIAPELHAISLTERCYGLMFSGCSSLNSMCVHFEQWDSYDDSTWGWVRASSSGGTFSPQGTFRCPTSLPQEFGPDRIPEGWTVETFDGGGNSDVIVTTYTPQDITANSAQCGVDAIVIQGSTLNEIGVCWNTSGNPIVIDNKLSTEVCDEPFVCTLTGLLKGTKYYVRAYALRGSEYHYGEEKSFTTFASLPGGMVNGLFSVGNAGQVYFSQGNLQYQASTNTWRFAESQYDYIGYSNSNISSSYSGWIDLFGWGTSGYNHGAVCYQPWSTSQISDDYYAYGSDTYNLNDQSGMADWGYNDISNGEGTTNAWRTLTVDEWNFVFNERYPSSGIRYAKARVNGVNGVILLPDDWNANTYSLNEPNASDADFSTNIINGANWITMESAGAVFLPTAGKRYGTDVFYVNGTSANYWSASYLNSNYAYCLQIDNDLLIPETWDGRYTGKSVRLVYPADN